MHSFVNPRRWRSLVLGVALSGLLCVTASRANGDAFTIDQLYHNVGVDAPSGHDAEFLTTVENPCHRTLSAQVGNSSSVTALTFDWAEEFGHFLIQSTQNAEGVPARSLKTSTFGVIYITPSVNLLLTIDASWTFDLPVWYSDSLFYVSVSDVSGSVGLFDEESGGSTGYPDPASGTGTIDGQVVLPAGETWVLHYYMNIYNDSESPGNTATGSGYVDFALQPLPEPSTAALLVFSWLMLAARRRKPR